ncbi:MAG: hypothetical protein HN595_03410 [Flavobacteriaceae bacterium]|jgi:hypothetical protein|nr:hypothetical protein [Flavobacteriaceae bacterium]
MNKRINNLIVYVSSRNNYDMLENEVFKNINLEGFEFINVDDCSEPEEQKKGKEICRKRGIVFLENKSRGVQMATQTLIDFINKNRKSCKWIICFQHDNYPISKNFFETISKHIKDKSLDRFGLLGFNNLDFGSYTLFSYYKYLLGFNSLGMIGMLHLTKYENKGGMWLCPRKQFKILNNKKWKKPFIIEFPMWASIGINVNHWNSFVKPSTNYHFHLWLPDVAMQLNEKNKPCLVIPSLYCFNNQNLKKKYGISWNSATSSKAGNSFHFGKYSNFQYWEKRWGWDFNNPRESFDLSRYKDTLFEKFYNHDLNKGPLKNFNI